MHDYDYQLLNSQANLRKAIRFDTLSRANFTFTVAPIDSVSDIIFYIKDSTINSYRLYRHYQVTGTVDKSQYCSSVAEYDCFYHTYISMQSNLDFLNASTKSFEEEIFIDVLFTQVPPSISNDFSHSSWINHETEFNTHEIFDGSVFNLTIKKPEGVDLVIKEPLSLLKEFAYKQPSNAVVLDFNTNQVDKLFMVAGTKLYVFEINFNGDAIKLLREHPVGPHCRHVYPVPKTEDFVIVCYGDDQIYSVSSYTFDSPTAKLVLQWTKVVNSHSFKGKMTPDGKFFFILYDISDGNYHFIEQYSLDPNATTPVYFVGFRTLDFHRFVYNSPLSNNTFIQAFDVKINQAGDRYLMFAITNDDRIIICNSSMTNGSNSVCRSRLDSIFNPRPEQKPEYPIYNQLVILNDTHFIVNTLNSYTYCFSALYWTHEGHDDFTFLSADTEMALAYFSDYPKYSQVVIDDQNSVFVIANNGSSEDPSDCVLFMYRDIDLWNTNEEDYVEPPLKVFSRSCPLPTYSPKILLLNGSLLMIDDFNISFYSSRSSYSLKLEYSGMFEPSYIELPLIASNQYNSTSITWIIYGNLLYRPINYIIWISNAVVWFLIFVFFLRRSNGVHRQLKASLSKYIKKVSRKASDLGWEMSLPMGTIFFIFFFGKFLQIR